MWELERPTLDNRCCRETLNTDNSGGQGNETRIGWRERERDKREKRERLVPEKPRKGRERTESDTERERDPYLINPEKVERGEERRERGSY